MLIVGIIAVTSWGTEAIGGIVGGLTVLVGSSVFLWAVQRFRRFEVRFLDPTESVTAEHMKKSIAVALPTGNSVINMSLRPRVGVELRIINFAFFDNPNYPKRLLATSVGRRRSISDIQITALRRLNNDSTWTDFALSPRGAESLHAEMGEEFYEHSRVVYQIAFETTASMKEWDGIFGIQLRYEEGGNLALRNIHEKVFVASSGTRRPFSFAFRGVQWAKANQQRPTVDRADSQP